MTKKWHLRAKTTTIQSWADFKYSGKRKYFRQDKILQLPTGLPGEPTGHPHLGVVSSLKRSESFEEKTMKVKRAYLVVICPILDSGLVFGNYIS